MPGLVTRKLAAFFEYVEGAPGAEGPVQTLGLKNLRMSAKILTAGSFAMGECHLRIWGMTLSQMNQLSTLGVPIEVFRRNTLTLYAGDSTDQQLPQVYEGTIVNAWFDGSVPSEPVFQVLVKPGVIENLQPLAATSYPGSFNVASAIGTLAGQMGLGFENNGVTAVLSAGYYPGTGRQQAYKIAQAAGISIVIENGVLAIWPANASRQGDVPVISPNNGMMGYPGFTSLGISVRTLFNKSFRYGALVDVQGSILPQANNRWKIVTLAHDLEALVPGGAWSSELQLVNPAGPTRLP